jgi:ribonucleotide monophosphatase NagD (HAD superfamily)
VEIIRQKRRAFAIVVGREGLANQLQSCGFEKVIYKDTDQEIPIAIAEFKDSYGFDENSDFVLIVRNSEITSNVANIAPIPLKTNTDIYRAINNYLSDV